MCLGVLLAVLAVHAQEPVLLTPSWSVVLAEHTSGWPNTASTFEALRRVVIVENRVVVLYDAGPLEPDRGRVKSSFELVSLDIDSGRVQNQLTFQAFSTPNLFATNQDKVLVGGFDLKQLNPDLTPTGIEFKEPAHGRTIYISPDGTILAHEIHPGSELLNANTLRATGVRLTEGVPTTVSDDAVLTNNTYWYGDYPKDKAFVTLTNEKGQRLLFHGNCGGRPVFLNNTLALLTGCGQLNFISTTPGPSRQLQGACKSPDFAGVSRNGRVFAIRCQTMRGFDPQEVSSEEFYLYRLGNDVPIAVVHSSIPPSGYGASWSAFSSDGTRFVTGSERRLSLYQVP